MAVIWPLIPDWLITAAAAGLTGFVALLVGRWTGKREGASRAKSDALKDQLKSDERGRNAVAKEKRAASGASDRDLVDRLRKRDGDWM